MYPHTNQTTEQAVPWASSTIGSRPRSRSQTTQWPVTGQTSPSSRSGTPKVYRVKVLTDAPGAGTDPAIRNRG
jgi:hypothetical protein